MTLSCANVGGSSYALQLVRVLFPAVWVLCIPGCGSSISDRARDAVRPYVRQGAEGAIELECLRSDLRSDPEFGLLVLPIPHVRLRRPLRFASAGDEGLYSDWVGAGEIFAVSCTYRGEREGIHEVTVRCPERQRCYVVGDNFDQLSPDIGPW